MLGHNNEIHDIIKIITDTNFSPNSANCYRE